MSDTVDDTYIWYLATFHTDELNEAVSGFLWGAFFYALIVGFWKAIVLIVTWSAKLVWWVAKLLFRCVRWGVRRWRARQGREPTAA